MTRIHLTRRRTARIGLVLAVVTTAVWASPASANSPDPIFGGSLFDRDQPLIYSWQTGKVPPTWMQNGINAGAENSRKLTLATNAQGTRIPTFTYGSGGTSKISMEQTPCNPSNLLAIACMTRSAPNSFTVKLNKHDMQLQGFTLKWCSGYAFETPPASEPASGCYDVANITLDELGHVAILDHHDNSVAGSTYTDAVVQAFSRTKDGDGWNADVYGRCDVASLQAQYGMTTSSKLYSTCLTPRVAPSLAFSASPALTPQFGNVTFSATLTTGNWPSDYGDRISLKPAHARTVILQRAPIGSTSFTNYLTMSPGTTAGTYTATVAIGGTYQWRANFPQPTNEGFLAARASVAQTVTCTNC